MKTPYPFVLDALEGLPIFTRPLFGCLGVYLDDKILLALRQKPTQVRDNGCWVATVPEHHASLAQDFPSLRSIEIFGPGPTGWQNLPEEAMDFESSALELCEAIRRGDPRIGKVPKKRKAKGSKAKTPKKQGRRRT